MPNDSPISEKDLADAVIESAKSLTQQGIRYAVVGGLAAMYRSQPRYTKDVDLLLSIPQISLPGLLADLAQRGFEFDEMSVIREWTHEHMTKLFFRGIPVDWLKPVLPMYQHILDGATTESWHGQPVRVASMEGVILLKLLAFRTQDLLDIENMVANAEHIDLDWIRSEWQTILPLDDPRIRRLEELIEEAKRLP